MEYCFKEKPNTVLHGHTTVLSGDLCGSWPDRTDEYDYEYFTGDYESIAYWKQKKPYYRPLPCVHIRNRVIPTPIESYTVTSVATKKCSDNSYKAVSKETTIRSGNVGHTVGRGPRLPTIPDLSQAHREALEFFGSACQPLSVNLAVNVMEIKETIALAKRAWDIAKLIHQLSRGFHPYVWGMYIRRLKRLDSLDAASLLFQDISSQAANLFLEYSFAIKPLVSDIIGLTTALDRISAHAWYLIANNKQEIPVRFSKDLTDLVRTSSIVFPSLANTTARVRGEVKALTNYKCIYNASARAKYDVSGMHYTEVIAKLKKRALGFANPLVFLWNVATFSFLIDWVIDVGGYIKSLPGLQLIPMALSQPCHSVKIDQTNVTGWYDYYGTGYTPRIANQQIVYTDLRNYYKRETTIPLSFKGIDVSLPNIKQLMLALALGRTLFGPK